jgi:hypothetical protein
MRLAEASFDVVLGLLVLGVGEHLLADPELDDFSAE